MTKLFIAGILAAAVLTGGTAAYAYQNGGGTGFIDADGDGVCDSGYCAFVDEDGDGVCDNFGLYGGRGSGCGAGFLDADGDGVCDDAGTNCLYGGAAARDGTGRQFHGGNRCGRN